MAPEPATRAAAEEAANRLFRGVVAASSVVAGDVAVTIEKGQPWGEPGPLPPDGVVVASIDEARVRGRGRPAAPRAGSRHSGSGRRPLPHARRPGSAGDGVHGRPRRGPHRRPPPLVRGPSRGPRARAGATRCRGHERAVARRVELAPTRPPERRRCSTSSRPRLGRPTGSRCGPACPRARTCRIPASPSAGWPAAQFEFPRPMPVELDGELVGGGPYAQRSTGTGCR